MTVLFVQEGEGPRWRTHHKAMWWFLTMSKEPSCTPAVISMCLRCVSHHIDPQSAVSALVVLTIILSHRVVLWLFCWSKKAKDPSQGCLLILADAQRVIMLSEMCISLYWPLISCVSHSNTITYNHIVVLWLFCWSKEVKDQSQGCLMILDDAQEAIRVTSSDIHVSEMCISPYWPLISCVSHSTTDYTYLFIELCCDCSVCPRRWRTHHKAAWWFLMMPNEPSSTPAVISMCLRCIYHHIDPWSAVSALV